MIFFAGIAEAAFGNLNIVLPLLPLTGFYFCVVAGWRKVVLPLLLVAGMLDAIWLRTIPAESLIAIMLMIGAEQWREWGDMFSWLALALAGLAIGFVSIVLLLLNCYFSADGVSLAYLWRLMFWLLLSPFALPLVRNFFQYFASVLELTGLQCEHAAILRSRKETGGGNDYDEE